MADTETVIQDANSTETVQTQERTFTQTELDEIVKARVAKERAKFGDYEALQQKASKLDEIEEANKSELQKATERADALQKQIDDMTKATELRNMRDKVATEKGIPVSLLTADTEEACIEQADAIISFAGTKQNYPSVKDGGEVQVTQKKSTQDQFADWLNASFSN